ncbi:MAG: hypothetical protein M1829_001123 [Trizodia sp. TS-e1964]|nr:MAG: hypothetical protein M1829_001123 [Trizodia sp. TS-e1964]
MAEITVYLLIYVLGGITFIPFLLTITILHAYLTLPNADPSASITLNDSLQRDGDPEDNIQTGLPAEKFLSRGQEADVTAGYFAVCREFVPGGINGKPPERSSPAGPVVAAESPSVYQSMYRSLFDRAKTVNTDTSKGNGKPLKRARNMFFVVLRHGHLMLYDDSDQLEVRHVISLAHHDISIYSGEDFIPEGELWIRRNAICLKRKLKFGQASSDGSVSKPFYLFSDNCSGKEDFYFALLQNQECSPDSEYDPPVPLQFDVKNIITLVQSLHSSEEHLQTRWINGLVGRFFLAVYKSAEVEKLIRNKISKKISRVNKPSFLSNIVLQKIDLGDGPPYIKNPRLKDLSVQGECVVEADLTYTGNFRLEVSTIARIDLGSRFKAREVNLVLAVVLKRLEGHVLIRFKPPPSNRIWITFENMPAIDMSIEPIVSARQITYTIILRAIENRIKEVIAESIVMPNWDDWSFSNTLNQHFRGGIWANGPQHSQTSQIDGKLDEQMEHLEGDPIIATPSQEPRDSSPRAGANKSKATRTESYSPLITPLVGTDSATAELDKSKGGRPDSASVTVAISGKSQNVLPISSFGSPSSKPGGLDKDVELLGTTPLDPGDSGSIPSSRNASGSSDAVAQVHNPGSNNPSESASLNEGFQDQLPGVRIIDKGAAESSDRARGSSISYKNTMASASQSPSLASDTSDNGGFYPQKFAESLKLTRPSADKSRKYKEPGSISEKRQSLASLSAATVAAKKWGLGFISRNVDSQREFAELEREGKSLHPIGRGRPLPPPGIPLPPPERPDKILSGTKRNQLPPPLPPQCEDTRTMAAPPLPKRIISTSTNFPNTSEYNNDDMIVIKAPSDEPSSPLLE